MCVRVCVHACACACVLRTIGVNRPLPRAVSALGCPRVHVEPLSSLEGERVFCVLVMKAVSGRCQAAVCGGRERRRRAPRGAGADPRPTPHPWCPARLCLGPSGAEAWTLAPSLSLLGRGARGRT